MAYGKHSINVRFFSLTRELFLQLDSKQMRFLGNLHRSILVCIRILHFCVFILMKIILNIKSLFILEIYHVIPVPIFALTLQTALSDHPIYDNV